MCFDIKKMNGNDEKNDSNLENNLEKVNLEKVVGNLI